MTMRTKLEEFPDSVVGMMQAIFDLAEAAGSEPDFSIQDLIDILRLALAEGQEMIELYLVMWLRAVETIVRERKDQ